MEPIIGSKVYVWDTPSSIPDEDGVGGLATISRIETRQYPDISTTFIEVEEIPGCEFNWKILMSEQEKLKKEFGDQVAHLKN